MEPDSNIIDNNIKTAEYKQGLVLYVKGNKQETVAMTGFGIKFNKTESVRDTQYKLYLTKRPSRPPLIRTFFQAGLRPMLFINSRLPKYR